MQGETEMNVRNGIDNVAQLFPPQAATASSSSKTAGSTSADTLVSDKAQLSAAGTQVAQTSASSDVRLDKVAGIQAALQAGTYHVPAADVAKKVVDSLLAPEK
jgi:negative regulator of flagellin synthesis FlgM